MIKVVLTYVLYRACLWKSRYIQVFNIPWCHPHGFGCCLFTLNYRVLVICCGYSKVLFNIRLSRSLSAASRSNFRVDVQWVANLHGFILVHVVLNLLLLLWPYAELVEVILPLLTSVHDHSHLPIDQKKKILIQFQKSMFLQLRQQPFMWNRPDI